MKRVICESRLRIETASLRFHFFKLFKLWLCSASGWMIWIAATERTARSLSTYLYSKKYTVVRLCGFLHWLSNASRFQTMTRMVSNLWIWWAVNLTDGNNARYFGLHNLLSSETTVTTYIAYCSFTTHNFSKETRMWSMCVLYFIVYASNRI